MYPLVPETRQPTKKPLSLPKGLSTRQIRAAQLSCRGVDIRWTSVDSRSGDTTLTGQEPLHSSIRSTLTVFIPLSEQACDEQARLSRVIGVVYPGHGDPSTTEMIEGLRAISASFAAYEWKFVKSGNLFILLLPSADGLDHVVRRTSIHCKGHKAYFQSTGEQATRASSTIASPLWQG